MARDSWSFDPSNRSAARAPTAPDANVGWLAAVPCASENYSADQMGGADEDGAVWVSVTSACRDFTDGWFRVRFTVE